MNPAASCPLAVEARGLTKLYGQGKIEVVVLRDVSLEVRPGRWWRCWGTAAPADPRCGLRWGW